MDFNEVFGGIGTGAMYLNSLREQLSTPRGVDEYFAKFLYALRNGSTEQIVGAVSSFLWIMHEYKLKDLILDPKRFERYEKEAEEAPDQLDVLFPAVASEDAILKVWLAVDDIDVHPVLVEEDATEAIPANQVGATWLLIDSIDFSQTLAQEEAVKQMFVWISDHDFEVTLLKLCIKAILKYQDEHIRADCAMLFCAICSNCFIRFDSAFRLLKLVVRLFDNDHYSEEFGSMFPAIEASVKFAYRASGRDDPYSSPV